MKQLGLDIGSKTIGVAVSDSLGWTAQPLEIIAIDEVEGQFGLERLEEIIRDNQIDKIIIGLPKNMNNTQGPRIEVTKKVGQLILDRFEKPIEYIDERLTTAMAQRMLTEEANVSRNKRKKVIDKMAAALILQTYLDRKNNERKF